MASVEQNIRWHQFNTRSLLVVTTVVACITTAYSAHVIFGWFFGSALGAFLAGGLRENDIFGRNAFRAFFGSIAGGSFMASSQAAIICTIDWGFRPETIVLPVMLGCVGAGIGGMVALLSAIVRLWVGLIGDHLRRLRGS